MDLSLDGEDDPRTGSAREDSDGGGTLSKSGTAGESESLVSMLGTLVPVLVISAVCLIVFWVYRRRLPRVYSPRAILRHLFPEEKTSAPSKGWFDWVKPFFKEGDIFVLNHSSLDAYLFLRYLKVLSGLCFVGCCIMWPILMPVHATGGKGLSELDSMTMGNVANPDLFYVHVAVAWVFFGIILFTIYRECIYYINLRHAYLLSPYYANRLSSRTVLFQSVPDAYLDANRLREVLGDSIKHVWMLRDTTDLGYLVEEREETALRLEKAEIQLIKKADVARKKGQRSAPSRPWYLLPLKRNKRAGETGETPGATGRRDPHDATSPSTTAATMDESSSTSSSSTSASVTPTTPITPATTIASPDAPNEAATATTIAATASSSSSDDPEKHAGIDSPLPDVNGSVAAQWVPSSHRPGHRPVGNFFRRVDTIKWTRTRMKLLTPQINKLRRKLHAGDQDGQRDGQQGEEEGKGGGLLSSVFVEFRSQSDAQRACQTVAHDKPLQMSPRYVGVRPDEVVWSSLRIGWFSRMLRRFGMLAFIVAAIVFWAIPSAFVGMLANLNNLTDIFVFLKFLELLPGPVLGLIQGFLPALGLSLLMAIVPWMLRGCARIAGEPSLSRIELYVQDFYFAFQVIQVFLVTTLTSAASAAITDVIEDPFSAPDLLSQNLPKASNFYLSYILIQCLAVGATSLLRFWDLLKHGIMTRFIQSPRSTWRIYKRVMPVHWGGWFPVFTNMGVIAISYSCIAPIILGFASVGLYMMYLVNKYNLLFVEDSSIDTRGLVYPCALKHLHFGLYLAEVCLIGLFGLNQAFGPLVLMVIFLIFSILFHLSLSDALSPLLANLPRTLAIETEEFTKQTPPESSSLSYPPPGAVDPASIPLPPDNDDGVADEDDTDDEDTVVHETTGSRLIDSGTLPLARSMGVEGSPSLLKMFRNVSWNLYVRKFTEGLHKIGLGPAVDHIGAGFDAVAHPAYSPDPNWLMRFLHPATFDSFEHLRARIPAELRDMDPAAAYPGDYVLRTYYPPEMWMPAPKIWIPRDDEGGVSRQEVEHCWRVGKVVASDEGAWLDGDGKVRCEVEKAPFWEERALY